MILTLQFIEETFNRFNTEYFKGELPIPNFQIVNTYRMLGQCGAKNWRAEHPNFIIKISNHFNRTPHDYQNTILHEMIHLYFQSKGMWKIGHGLEFQQMARTFDKYGWNVHTKEEGFKGTTTNGTIPTRVVMTFEEVEKDVIWVCCVANDNVKIRRFFQIIKNCKHYTTPSFFTTNSDKFGGLKISHKKLGGITMAKQKFNNEYLPTLKSFDL